MPSYVVAPFTGAWIEIQYLKEIYENNKVAPFTGAWIEIPTHWVQVGCLQGRTLHGCVD